MNRVVVVSNRVPDPQSKGSQAGGLAVALEGLMAKRGGVWFGWSGKIAADATQNAAKSATHGSVEFVTLDLSPDEHARYYSGYSNGVLWPLLHTMPELMSFDRRDAQVYREVNVRFADALFPLLRPNDLIWVHDYHLMALPGLLRGRNVRNPIGFFLHIPFPSADVLATVPEAAALVRDLLAADLIGFQTERDVANFADAARSFAGASPSQDGWLTVGNHRVRLGAFPVEIDANEFVRTAEQSWRSAPTERLRRTLHGQNLILGVDRLDPTKGLLQRLAGYRRLLDTHEDWRRRTTFVQIAALSRQDVTSYRDLRTELDREAGAINSEFGDPDWTPLRIIARAGARNTVAGYMREARVGLVTPVRDGMNLVSKEYVAAQDPQDPGVLVLSRFAGAAYQLHAALIVNPHDPDDIADALDRALRMPLSERQARWNSQWKAIADSSPSTWGRSFLAALIRSVLWVDVPAGRPRMLAKRATGSLAALRTNLLRPTIPDPRQVN